MTSPIRRGFHSEMAALFANDIRFKRSNYYYFLGKIDAWGVPDLIPEVQAPDSDSDNDIIRANALFAKKITPNDISEVTTRYSWVTGVVYAKWDNTKDMSGQNFYVVTSDYAVYKCLDNAGGAVSTVKPTGTSFSVVRTADGYLWKYMYTIPAFKRSRFSSLVHMPVQRALSDSFYNKGTVNDVIIENGGSGYPDAQLTTISVMGTTTGSGAVGTITVGLGGAITGAVITNGGTGYTSGVDLGITSGTGINGVIEAVIVGGVITGIDVIDPGQGYTSSDDITFSVGGAELVPLVSRVTGTIESVKIVKSGAGYVGTPTLSVSGSGGTGKYGNPSAILSAVTYQGRIVQVNMADPGIDYPSDNDTTIVVQGTGTGAEFSPVIYNGEIVGVVVENPGIGYTSVSLTVVGSGSGAILTPVATASDFISDQSIVEQTTVPGAIYAIESVNKGTGYTSGATANVIGDGTGCMATPVVLDGVIDHYIVTEYGEGYTYADIVITDTARETLGSVDATSYAILPPRGGHGKDAVNELFGNTIVINSSMRQERFLGSIVQDYRQFGLIRNPKDVLTGAVLNGDSYLAAFKVRMDTVVGLELDQILIRDTTKFRVVFIDSGNIVYLQQLGTRNINPFGTFLTEVPEGDTPTVYQSLEVQSTPNFDKYSGSLLYVSNEAPFSLTENQGIIIKTFLTF